MQKPIGSLRRCIAWIGIAKVTELTRLTLLAKKSSLDFYLLIKPVFDPLYNKLIGFRISAICHNEYAQVFSETRSDFHASSMFNAIAELSET